MKWIIDIETLSLASSVENVIHHLFLDINIFRDRGKFPTSVYRKPTFSEVLINLERFLPVSYKYNLNSTLLYRGFTICTSYRTLRFEILELRQIFRSNRYPQGFLDCFINMYLDKVFIKHPFICVVPKYVCLYCAKMSVQVKKCHQIQLKNPY